MIRIVLLQYAQRIVTIRNAPKTYSYCYNTIVLLQYEYVLLQYEYSAVRYAP